MHGKVILQATHEHPQPLFVMIKRQDKSKAVNPRSETQIREIDRLRRTPGILRQPDGARPYSPTNQGAFHFVVAAYLVAFISLKIPGLLHSLVAFPTMPAWFA